MASSLCSHLTSCSSPHNYFFRNETNFFVKVVFIVSLQRLTHEIGMGEIVAIAREHILSTSRLSVELRVLCPFDVT